MKKKPYTVRFDPWILSEIRSLARFERRSINDQILYMLEDYIHRFLDSHPGYEGPTAEDDEVAGVTYDESHPDE